MQGVVKLLQPGSLLLQQQVQSKKRALEVLGYALAERLKSVDSDLLLELLTDREQLGSTAMGGGVAIPHCRIASTTDSAAAILTLAQGVPFDAPDGAPVDVFLALAVPQEAHEQHLQYLAELAAFLQVPENLQMLRDSRDPERLLAALDGA